MLCIVQLILIDYRSIDNIHYFKKELGLELRTSRSLDVGN